MPSIGTNILSARVKDETIKRFKAIAEEYQTTVPKILDALAGVTKDAATAAFFMPDGEIQNADLYSHALDLVDDLCEAGISDKKILHALENIRREML